MGGSGGGLPKMNKLFGKDVSILTVWLMPTGIVFVLVLVFVSVVIPKIEEIQSTFSNIDKVTREIVLVNQKRAYLLSVDQEDLQMKSTLVENGVLSEKNSYLLIKIISKVVASFGYSVGDFSVNLGDIKEIDKKSPKFDYQKVPVEVMVSGPKSNFLAMVTGIEKSLPVLSIDNFSLTGTGDVANIKMNVSAYYLLDWTQGKLENLSVADLTPGKEETDVLSQIGSFKYYGDASGEIGSSSRKFEPSSRIDPFY